MNLMEFVTKPEIIETKDFPFTEYELQKIKWAKEWQKDIRIVVELQDNCYRLRAIEILP